jgi:hypothetical protein
VKEIFHRAAHAQFSPEKNRWDEKDKLAEKIANLSELFV